MTKREHRPLAYDATLNRRQPEPFGCIRWLPLVFVLVGALVCAGTAFSLSSTPAPEAVPTLAALPSETVTTVPTAINATATPTATATPDAWGATGTALANATISPTPTASPTLNYCWWLVPTATATATLPYTPDSWQATGTAVYMATHPYQSPTPAPPRELCVEFFLTPTAEALIGFGPLGTPSATPERLSRGLNAASAAEGATNMARLNQGNTGATQAPRQPAADGGVTVREVVITSEPQIIVHTAPPPAPQVIVQTVPPVIVYPTMVVPTEDPYWPLTVTSIVGTMTAVSINQPTATPTRDAAWYASATAYYSTVNPIRTATAAVPTATLQPTEPPVVVTTEEPDPLPYPTQPATLEPTATATSSPTATATMTPTPTPDATEVEVTVEATAEMEFSQ